MGRLFSKRPKFVQVFLLALNGMMTFVTLFTGLRENPVITMATGKYDAIRNRFLTGSINTDILELDMYRTESIATPQQMADYTFINTPTRSIKTFGEDVSVCTNVNTNSAPVMLSHYDDFWGKSARRVQIYVNSISVPKCDILNVKPEWRAKCVADRQGNATKCYKYILDNFDTLQADRSIRMRVVKDLGLAGNLFLRCSDRPMGKFAYKADRLAHQAYWNGAEYHITLQTSVCNTTPLLQSSDLTHTLFESFDISDKAEMLVLLPRGGWVAFIVPWLQGIVALVVIAQGVMFALFHTKTANYLPHGVRYPSANKMVQYLMPFMEMTSAISGNARAIITFKGSLLILSDFWITHWLYMWLSILDAIVNIRSTYVTYQMAASLLIARVTLESIIYLLMSLIKITWIMCLVQTILQTLLKIAVRFLRAVRLIKSTTREKIEWTIDSMAMFLSFRIYYLFLFIIAILLIYVKGDPSFMVRSVPYKVGAYGGPIDIAGFWGSEVACDLVTLLALLTAASQIFGLAMLCTKYRYVANNSVIRFLQKRYFIAGWDGLMAAEMLGLDPYDDDVIVDGLAYTQFSIGSLLQLLYLSGPSGFVHLAGDYIFHDNGFSQEPRRFSYPIAKALEMGLFDTGKGSAVSSSHPTTALTTAEPGGNKLESSATIQPPRTRELIASALIAKKSIFERRLRVVNDGYLGKLLFIDAKQAGQIVINRETGQREYEVVDALTTMSILDIKYLMGREKRIRVQ